jgi:hypothetical protein
MGQVDFIDLLRLIAGGLEVGHQLAEGRAEQAARAGIDQNQLAAGVDQEAVDRRFGRHGLEVARQRLGGDGSRLVQQFVDRQVDGAVAEAVTSKSPSMMRWKPGALVPASGAAAKAGAATASAASSGVNFIAIFLNNSSISTVCCFAKNGTICKRQIVFAECAKISGVGER